MNGRREHTNEIKMFLPKKLNSFQPNSRPRIEYHNLKCMKTKKIKNHSVVHFVRASGIPLIMGPMDVNEFLIHLRSCDNSLFGFILNGISGLKCEY